MVAMVNSGPDTSGSQFFITYGPAAQYDGQYTIFGQVLSGMEVVEALSPRDAQPGAETPPGDQLLSVSIEER
jgi:cyclophilin family peptidyl-prolyl cis-trans isomerase